MRFEDDLHPYLKHFLFNPTQSHVRPDRGAHPSFPLRLGDMASPPKEVEDLPSSGRKGLWFLGLPFDGVVDSFF